MKLLNVIEEILVRITSIISLAFHVNYEPVKLKKMPELSVPEVRNKEF